MKVLLSNDDGVHAEGIACLYQALSELAEVIVIAPDRNCSGASNSLTLTSPLRVEALSNGFYSVNGTPTDCVHLGINQLIQPEPELVVAGINHGANLGDDVIYSGTVAAATEGRHMGLPAIAVSLVGKQYFTTAAQVVVQVIKKLLTAKQENTEFSLPLASDQILNINVPDLPLSEIKGIKVTRCGSRHRAETMTKTSDPHGRPIFWYGAIGDIADAAEDTDFNAVENGYVSITPLTIDMTAYKSMPALSEWAQTIKVQ